jgi:branched-chain amino acid transport system ATP-binding protein
MLEIEDVCMSYGEVQVLHDVCLRVIKGEIVAIVGSNGSGKTSLLRCLSGLQPASAGRISFLGVDISHMRPDSLVSLGISQVPEGRHIFPTLSVYANLEMGAYLQSRRKSKAELLEAFEFVFELFPILRTRRKQKGGTLSGGEQQMLAIARALTAAPQLLILDEPSMGLAPLVVRDILKAIRHLNGTGLTVLLVEQNVAASLAISTRGYVLQLGRVVLEGKGEELLEDNAVRAIYLGERLTRISNDRKPSGSKVVEVGSTISSNTEK